MKEMQNKLFEKTSSPIEAMVEPAGDSIRLNRSLKVIDNSLEKFVNTVQKHKIQTEALCVEIEEFKSARESLKSELQQTLQVTLNQEMAKITCKQTQELRSSIETQLNESLKENVELLQKIQKEAELAISGIQGLGKQSKHWFIHRGLFLVATVCFSCFVMASALFYFFPQQQYVRYEMNQEQAKQMLVGKSTLDNFKKLKQEDQKLLADAIEVSIKQMVNGLARR